MTNRIRPIFLWSMLLALLSSTTLYAQETFNQNWKYFRMHHNVAKEHVYAAATYNDAGWQSVSLPHTAHVEPLVVNNQWQGLCWYRKHFDVTDYSKNKKYIIELEAAMSTSKIWINGQLVTKHEGGFLPVVMDVTSYLKATDNVIAISLDSRDNPNTGPKPLKILDFNTYGGLYRNAWFITENKVHITHPNLVNKPAGGGVFITFPKVSTKKSIVQVRTEVANESNKAQEIVLVHKIFKAGQLVKEVRSKAQSLAAGTDMTAQEEITIKKAALWSPDAPNLYELETTVLADDQVVDTDKTRFGIRTFTFKDNQLYINGKKTYLRGVNRHQEYPFVGYALSDNAQYRDAYKIKQAGFDYVRLSHYPQSPAFMDACDELGLVVADAILGWQYYKENDAFKNYCYNSARQLIRRDRNHACVMAWEVSLNETKMPIPFMQQLDDIVHEEYPGDKVYSCGWMPEVYNIYFQARQHRILHKDHITFEKPYIVSEYGDWEYYSKNAGLNQHNHSKQKRLELSSRQLRGQGEVRLLQQAYNIQEAHNDNMSIPATGDGYWVMYDYNRGYHDDIEASGVMDIFRLPKFSYDFYRSQRDASSADEAVLKIATYWTKQSPSDVRVYSNCDKVSLYLNDKLVATQTPDKNDISSNLHHPPFTFKVGQFERGTLRAEGFLNGKKVQEAEVRSPGKPVALKCWVDESNRAPQAGCNDVVFLYVAAVDAQGTICPTYKEIVAVTTDANTEVMNVGDVQAEAGIATALLRLGDQSGDAQVNVQSGALKGTYTLTIK